MKKTYILAFSIFILSILYYSIYLKYGISLSDEGYIINGVLRVMQGKLCGKDFHAYAPGRYYLIALFFKLFGTNLIIERIVFMIFLSFNTILIFFVARKIMPELVALIPALITMIIPGPWHKAMDIYFFLMSLLTLIKYANYRNLKNLFILGFISGLTLFFRTYLGLFLLFTTPIYIAYINFNLDKSLNKAIKHSILFITIMFCTLLPFALYLIYKSSFLPTLQFYFFEYLDILKYPINIYTSKFPALINLINYPSSFELIIFLYVFCIVYLVSCFALIIKYKHNNYSGEFYTLLLICFWGIFYFCQVYEEPDISHLLQAGPLTYMLFAYLLYNSGYFLLKKMPFHSLLVKSLAKYLLFIMSFILIIFYIIEIMNKKGSISYYTGSIIIRYSKTVLIKSDKAHVYVQSSLGNDVNRVIEFFNSNSTPKDGLLCLPYLPMFNFLTNMENPTGLDIWFPFTVRGKQEQQKLIKDIATNIHFILFNKPDVQSFRGYAPILYKYIESHFKIIKQIGPFLIMKSKYAYSDPELLVISIESCHRL